MATLTAPPASRSLAIAHARTLRPIADVATELGLRPDEFHACGRHVAKVHLDVRRNERALIEEALQRFRGNRRKAAEALNMSTVTLWRRLRQYGLSGPDDDTPTTR